MSIAESPRARHEMEDGESVNAIKSEVLVDESMLVVERFDAVMKDMKNMKFGATKSYLIYFVNPKLLWSSTNWSWIETEFAESMVTIKHKTAQWMRIICNRDSGGAKIFFASSSKDLHVRNTTENESWIFMILRKHLQ